MRLVSRLFGSLSKARLQCPTKNHNHTATAYDLSNYRSILSVKGPDSAVYLQNIITNDIQSLNSDNKQSIFAMMLNNRGRLMYDTVIYNNNNDGYLMEIDSKFLNEAMRYLSMFKIKKKVQIKIEGESLKLFSVIDVSPDMETKIASSSNSISLTKDPRYAGLGHRLITREPSDLKSNNVIIDTEIRNYKKLLYKNGIAENNEDILSGNSIPLEYNLVFLNGVSFNKGCYLGQELVAKTHHTGVIRKRIMPIRILDKNSQQFDRDSVILNTKTGKEAGKLRGIVDEYGIALIRMASIDKHNMVIIDSNKNQHKIDIQIPGYWQTDDEALKNELNNYYSS